MTTFGDRDRDHQILMEQVRGLYHSLLPILAANLVVSLALLYGLWSVVSQTVLAVWFGLMVFSLVLRTISYAVYRRRFSEDQVRRYAWYFVIGTGVTGALWGAGGVLLFPAQGLEYQLFILFVLVGMGAGAVSSLTAYMPAFLVFFPTSMLPIGVRLFMVGDPIHVALGVMSLAYVIALSYFALAINRTLKQSLKLRFENIDLVEQLREQKEEAEMANQSKSRFLAAASHDLRQPLHALSLFTSVLDESIEQPKPRKVVGQIKASVQALQSLFNTLLDISRLEAGVMKVEKTGFHLQALFDRLVNDFDPQASEKGLRIIWPTCSLAVYTDPTLLEQILRNYLANALRYTEQGEIRLECQQDGELLHIRVSDTGVGIPEEEHKAIFEEFHQLDNPERDRDKGLGLGLAIVQRTAKLLEHPIGVESVPGMGAIFSIAVERCELVDSELLNGEESPGARAAERTVLIVVIDDEVSVREGMQSLLEIWGCKVISVADQTEALAQIRLTGRVPDGIIADYRLREQHTGVGAIHAIYADCDSEMPALIVTGDIATERLHKVNRSGFQVLHKPVAPARLRAFVRNIQIQAKAQASLG